MEREGEQRGDRSNAAAVLMYKVLKHLLNKKQGNN